MAYFLGDINQINSIMKKNILIKALVSVSYFALISVGCERNTLEPEHIMPVLTTDTVINITHTTAVIESNIDSVIFKDIAELGICWNNNPSPTLADHKISGSADSSQFSRTIEGLAPDTYYYVRAYVIYKNDTLYGNSLSFKTWKPFPANGTLIQDIDGNTYHTIIIGNQVWLTENLKTTKFVNGEAIFHHTDTTQWAWNSVDYSAYSDYNNDPNISKVYGRLYNWLAVDDPKELCPEGWHVPSEADLTELINYLGGDSIAGGMLKESGTAHWVNPNVDATNESGFTALPTGYREVDGSYQALGFVTYIWSSSEMYSPYGVCLPLGSGDGKTVVYTADKKLGSPVRCIMDR